MAAVELSAPGETADATVEVNPEFQGLCRAFNLHQCLIEVLKYDYNIAYKGSIATREEKAASRARLLTTVTETMQLLTLFVQGNKRNQELILPYLPRVFALRNSYFEPPPHEIIDGEVRVVRPGPTRSAPTPFPPPAPAINRSPRRRKRTSSRFQARRATWC